jgi:hypothetical protein
LGATDAAVASLRVVCNPAHDRPCRPSRDMGLPMMGISNPRVRVRRVEA